MQLRLSFDDQQLLRDSAESDEFSFVIYWEHEGLYYPMKDWPDNGVVILGWWFGAAIGLLSGADEEVLPFMEGPYELRARYHREDRQIELSLSGQHVTWIISFEEFVEQLFRAADAVSTVLGRLGVGRQDQTKLQQWKRMLSSAISVNLGQR